MKILRKFMRNEKGATAIEYGLIATLIAIAAITVNIKKWTVKSSALGEMMIRKYFKERLEEKRNAKN